jgi:ThiF family
MGRGAETDVPGRQNERTMNFDRMKGASWFPHAGTRQVTIGGAGGIGSWLAVLLARTGARITIYDDDKVMPHNLGGQLFFVNSLGNFKVTEVARLVRMLTGSDIEAIKRRFESDSMITPVCFSAFDNMEARKTMFHRWHSLYKSQKYAIFIDGRLTMEHFQVFAVMGNDNAAQGRYMTEYLFEDKEVGEENCTMKQTSHSAAMTAAMMVSTYVNYLSRRYAGDPNAAVPLLTDMNLPLRYTFDDALNSEQCM